MAGGAGCGVGEEERRMTWSVLIMEGLCKG